MATYRATYGSAFTPCQIFVYKGWYVVEGSVNVNRTREEFFDGIDVEEIKDYDIITASKPIESQSELERLVDGYDSEEGDDFDAEKHAKLQSFVENTDDTETLRRMLLVFIQSNNIEGSFYNDLYNEHKAKIDELE